MLPHTDFQEIELLRQVNMSARLDHLRTPTDTPRSRAAFLVLGSRHDNLAGNRAHS